MENSQNPCKSPWFQNRRAPYSSPFCIRLPINWNAALGLKKSDTGLPSFCAIPNSAPRRFLAENWSSPARGEITVKEIEESTGVNHNTIKVHLRKLASDNYLVQVGMDRGARYTLKWTMARLPPRRFETLRRRSRTRLCNLLNLVARSA